ncbi:MAG: GntR family transcriptional regulator, partial [Deltaproteobacteria bacterium]|nr:GntR family transcriptional regulator [Deltaproteobacteria bacterium]
SRTPVNNALSILANEGYLDLVHHQGYTVHKITKEEAESLYEIRGIIELGCVSSVIRKLTPEKLEALEQKKRLYEKAVVDQVSRGRFTLDQEFHAFFIQISDILYLPDYFRDIYQRIFLRHPLEGLNTRRPRDVVLEHQGIFEAISVRDVEATKQSIKTHIKNGKEYIFSIIFD